MKLMLSMLSVLVMVWIAVYFTTKYNKNQTATMWSKHLTTKVGETIDLHEGLTFKVVELTYLNGPVFKNGVTQPVGEVSYPGMVFEIKNQAGEILNYYNNSLGWVNLYSDPKNKPMKEILFKKMNLKVRIVLDEYNAILWKNGIAKTVSLAVSIGKFNYMEIAQ
ncbi:MAG: hypothetical protein HZA35_01405 [Parcubacteria group bacterium]|nr:hypothetical protein [Parcubacteria group bacterium]